MIRVIEAISFSMETINSFPESLGPWPHAALAKHELPQVPCCKFITPSWKGNADTRLHSPEHSPANNVAHGGGSLSMQEAWEAVLGGAWAAPLTSTVPCCTPVSASSSPAVTPVGLEQGTQPLAPGKALAVPSPRCYRLLPAAPGEKRSHVRDICEKQCCLVAEGRVGPIRGSADG